MDKCVENGMPQTFTLSDIKSKYLMPPRSDEILDCTNLAEHLLAEHLKQHQLQNPELDYAI